MNTEEKIAVMQAYYDDGKQIQIKPLMSKRDIWTDLHHEPSWAWDLACYRIKPEPKYRPYKDKREMLEDYKERFMVDTQKCIPLIWVKNVVNNIEYLITSYGIHSVELCGRQTALDELFENYTYSDDTPCGKLVKE